MQSEMRQMVGTYTWPSQAFWRYFELQVLRTAQFERPVLEIGCGDGEFTSLVINQIDEAIDINPRSVEKAQSAIPCIYGSVRCMDARELHPKLEGYGTIYANCVMEHIPDLTGVLKACAGSLREGGKLIITVPLAEMNSHLMLRWNWYTKLRQRQLQHLNLFSMQQWQDTLLQLGFKNIEFKPYFFGTTCKFWDSMDAFACIGSGRYNLSTAFRTLGRYLLPGFMKGWIQSAIANWLVSRIPLNGSGTPCATAIIATK